MGCKVVTTVILALRMVQYRWKLLTLSFFVNALLLFYLYLVQRLQVDISAEEDPSLDKVRKRFDEKRTQWVRFASIRT